MRLQDRSVTVFGWSRKSPDLETLIEYLCCVVVVCSVWNSAAYVGFTKAVLQNFSDFTKMEGEEEVSTMEGVCWDKDGDRLTWQRGR